MRKLLLILFAALLCLTMTVTGFAQTADLVLSDVEANPGDTVYLTVELQTQLTADAMGLSYTYDEKILEPMPVDSWSWEVKGDIKNFDIKKDRAAWGANEPTQLQGDICVMAFRVLKNVKLTQTKVTCELIVKNQGQEVGTYTAEGLVGQRCEHEYSSWKSEDDLWHTVTCKHCGKMLTQSHVWDDGVELTVAGKRLIRFTCTACHNIREVELSGAESQETKPTGDSVNPISPTGAVSQPDQNTHKENTPDTMPTASVNDTHEDHAHQNTDGNSQTNPTSEEEIVEPTEEHTHDHTHEQVSQNNTATGIVVAVALALMLGAAIFFVKKK